MTCPSPCFPCSTIHSENLFVDDYIARKLESNPPSHHENPGDNRDELFRHFRLVLDPTHKKFAAGYQWFCRRCGKPCASTEVWFPCQNRFVTVKVLCHLGCFNHWRLKIEVRDEILEKVC